MIPKEELAILLQRRIIKKYMTIVDDIDEPGETTKQEILELATWLIDSGMVTEQTMFLVAGNPADSECARDIDKEKG